MSISIRTDRTDITRQRTWPKVHDLVERLTEYGELLVRVGLFLALFWFGALKIFGLSPVAPLLAATFPFVPTDLLLTGLGVAEVALAAAILIWRRSALPLLLIAAHLSGAFVTVALAPERLIVGGNPLVLTTEGEFVLKNVIVIGAILLVAGRLNRR